MPCRLSLLATFLVFLLPALAGRAGSPPPATDLGGPAWTRQELAPGVDFFQAHFQELFGGPQFVSVVRVALEEAEVRVRFLTPQSLERDLLPLDELAAGAGALAAINGGFNHGGPEKHNSGIFKVDGQVLPFLREEPEELRFVGGAALGIDDDEQWHFIHRPGDRWPADWPEVRHALAGGHRLVEDRAIHPAVYEMNSARARRHIGGRHPRTGIGLGPGRIAFLVTVDGRHPGQAEGMTLPEFARFMQDLGCVEALNLDGGGTTSMWVDGRGIVNHPSDNRQFDRSGARRVKSAVALIRQEKTDAPPRLSQ